MARNAAAAAQVRAQLFGSSAERPQLLKELFISSGTPNLLLQALTNQQPLRQQLLAQGFALALSLHGAALALALPYLSAHPALHQPLRALHQRAGALLRLPGLPGLRAGRLRQLAAALGWAAARGPAGAGGPGLWAAQLVLFSNLMLGCCLPLYVGYITELQDKISYLLHNKLLRPLGAAAGPGGGNAPGAGAAGGLAAPALRAALQRHGLLLTAGLALQRQALWARALVHCAVLWVLAVLAWALSALLAEAVVAMGWAS
jgi:hypothetical protein